MNGEHWIDIYDTRPDDFHEGDVVRWKAGDLHGTLIVGPITPPREELDMNTAGIEAGA